MPTVDEMIDNNDMLLRELLFGPPFAKKTWWVGNAAEAGYNVLLFDGDNGYPILKNISAAARKRIRVIPISDRLGQPVFAPTLVRFLKQINSVWDEKSLKFANLSSQQNEHCVRIDFRKLTKYDIVCVDSWTAFVDSLVLQYALEQNIDLTDAEKTDWDGYGWTGRLALLVIGWLVTLPCHVVVIAHETQYDKRSKDGKKVEFSRRQIKSTSGPNAVQIPAKFSEMLYFYLKGSAFKIDVKASDEAVGGTRILMPGTYNWDALQFKDIILAAGLSLPLANNPLIDYSINPNAASNAIPPTSGGLVLPGKKPEVKLVVGNIKANKKSLL
jgi:hypothetical protein